MDNTYHRNILTDTRKKGGGKGKGKAFYETLAFQKDQITAGLFLRGQYQDPEGPEGSMVPYFKYMKHTRQIPPRSAGGKPSWRDTVCSRGWNPHDPKSCFSCVQSSKDKSIGQAKLSAAHTFIHLALYHKHPLIGQDGKVAMKNDNSGAVMVDNECEHPNCNYCRILQGQPVVQTNPKYPFPIYNPADITTFFGRRRIIDVGSGHLAGLGGFEGAISEWCGTVGCGAKLRQTSLYCPQCNNILVDLASNPEYLKNINQYISQEFPCHYCNQRVFLNTGVTCDACAAANRQMTQFGLFDVIICATKTGENTKSQLVLSKFFTIEDYQTKMVQPAFLQGRSLRELITEIAQEPYDFEEMFAPGDATQQMKDLMYSDQQMQPQGQSSMYAPQQPQMGQMVQPQGMPQPGFQQPQQPQQPQYGAYPVPGQPVPQGFPVPQPQQPPQPGPTPFMAPPKPNFGQ